MGQQTNLVTYPQHIIVHPTKQVLQVIGAVPGPQGPQGIPGPEGPQGPPGPSETDELVLKAGDTMTGRLILANGDDVTVDDETGYLQIGASDGPNLGIDSNEIQSRSGDGVGQLLAFNAEGGEVRVNSQGLKVKNNRHVTDMDDRQFIRADTSRSSPIVLQAGIISATTSGDGDLSITFAEAFSSTPNINVTFYNTGSTVNIPVLRNVSTTGFTFRVYNTSAVAVTNQTRTFHWSALGPKTLS